MSVGTPTPGRHRRTSATTTVADVEDGATPGALLHSALAGDTDAWARIVDEYSRLLWWVARRHRLDDATAADVVQTVWLQLIRFGNRIEDPDRLPSWLATVARREALRRTSGRELPSLEIEDRSDLGQQSTEERVVDDDTLGIVLAAFEQLSDDDQRLLRLVCDVPPKSYEEVATLLGRSVGYVGPTRQRALNRLRTILTEMGLS